MERKPYTVKSDAPRAHAVPLQQRNWPRWYCPHCQAQHYLDIDVLMAVVRLTCSSCKTAWNVQIIFESAANMAKPKKYSLPLALSGEPELLCPVCCDVLPCECADHAIGEE